MATTSEEASSLNLVIRKAAPEDADEIAALAISAYEHYETTLGIRPPPMDEDYVHAIAEGHTWVAELSHSLVGFVILSVESDCQGLDGRLHFAKSVLVPPAVNTPVI